jgi:hypothetical protein
MKKTVLAVALFIALGGNAIAQSAYESSSATTNRSATRLSRDSSSSQDYRITRTVGFGTLGLEYALSRKNFTGGPLVDDSRRIWAWEQSGFTNETSAGNQGLPSKIEWNVLPYARVNIKWENGATPGKPIYLDDLSKRMPKFSYEHISHAGGERVFGKPFAIHDAYLPFLVSILRAKQLYVIAVHDLGLKATQGGVIAPNIEQTKQKLFARLDELFQDHEDNRDGIIINYKLIHRHKCSNLDYFERSQFTPVRDSLVKKKQIPEGNWVVSGNEIIEIKRSPDPSSFEPTGRKLTREQTDIIFASMRELRNKRLAECGGVELPAFIFDLNWPKLTECQIPTPVSLERGETKVRCGSENLGSITFDLDAKEMLAGGRKWFSQDTIEGIKMELAEAVAATDSKSMSTQRESSKEESRRSSGVITPR